MCGWGMGRCVAAGVTELITRISGCGEKLEALHHEVAGGSSCMGACSVGENWKHCTCRTCIGRRQGNSAAREDGWPTGEGVS